MMAWRDLRVRYAQTFLGVLWLVIQPLFTVVVLTFVFGSVAQVETNGTPHVLFTLVGLCGWTFFASLTEGAGGSILGAQDVVKKVYFPRLILPLSKLLTAAVDLGFLLIALCGMMIYYGLSPSSHVVYFPLFLLASALMGLTGGIWVSALSIRFRDFQYVMPLALRLGMFITPIAYGVQSVPSQYQWLYHLNPLTGIVEGMRWSILGGDFQSTHVWISIGVLVLLFGIGLVLFHRVESIMADII